jgi:hypothetical protein
VLSDFYDILIKNSEPSIVLKGENIDPWPSIKCVWGLIEVRNMKNNDIFKYKFYNICLSLPYWLYVKKMFALVSGGNQIFLRPIKPVRSVWHTSHISLNFEVSLANLIPPLSRAHQGE